MIPDNLEAAAQLKGIISRRQFAPSDEGREMTRALIVMLEKNSPPLLESIPTGLMRLFIPAEVADYLGIPDGQMQKCLANFTVEFGKFVDRNLADSQWQAMLFRHHILSVIEGMISVEAGDQRDFFRLPTNLHQKWRGTNPESETGLWGHLANWIVSRV
jgi:hypothetical protein